MVTEREIEQSLKNLQLDATEFDTRLEFVERRVRAIRQTNFVENFLSGLTDLGALGFISSHLDWKHVASPPNPSSGFQRIFADTDNSGHLTSRNSSGTEVDLEYLDADAIAAVEGEATLLLSGSVSVALAFVLSGDISPAQITANTNNYNPTNLDTSSTLRVSTDASRNLTGIVPAAPSDGRILILHNVGSQDLVLIDESASSSATNRFALSGNITLSGDESVVLQYDSTSSRWRIIGAGAGTYTDAEAIAAVEAAAPLNLAGPVVFNEAGADVDFRFEGLNDVNLLFLDASTDRVGIGIASPQELLHVGEGTNASDITATDLLVTRAGPSNLSVRDSTNGVETFLFASSVGGIMGTVTNDPLNIQTNNTSAIFIDASQKVGIGIGTPTAKFHIDQASTTAAIPVLLLDQADLSEQCIKFSSDAADRDINLFTVDVTGTPTLLWDEGEDGFNFSKGVAVTGTLTATSHGGITEANLVDKSASEAIAGTWAFPQSIADNAVLTVDGASNSGEYARFTAAGLVGRTEAEFKGDFNLEIGTDVLAEQTVGIADNNLVEIDSASVADDEYARFTAAGLESRSVAEVLSDIGAAASAHAMSTHSDEDSYAISTSGTATFGDLTLQGSLISTWGDLTISSGQVAVTKLNHTLAGEGAAADNLVGMSGGSDGMMVILHAVSDSVTITLKHNDVGGESSNGTRLFMASGADVVMDDIDDLVIAVFDSSLDTGGAWIVQTGGSYTNADAIAAVEGEATLVLTGDVSVASGKDMSLLTDGATGGLKLGASEDVLLFRGATDRLDLNSGDDLRLVSGILSLGETTDPGGVASFGHLYTKDVRNLTGLHYQYPGGEIVQLGVPWEPILFNHWLETTNGTGNIDMRPRRYTIGTGATSTAWAKVSSIAIDRWTPGVAANVIDWTLPILIKVTLSVDDNTTNGTFKLSLGKQQSEAVGDLAQRGIGIAVDNLALKGIAHDGTSLDTTSLGTLAAKQTYQILIVSDGAGNVEWFLDGVASGSTAAGPDAAGTAGDSGLQIEIQNQGDSATETVAIGYAAFAVLA